MPTIDVDNTSPVQPKWAALANGDTGSAWQLPPFRTAFFTASGTWGTDGSVQLEGSNDGINWGKLSPAALTAAGCFEALANNEWPKYIRPNVTAGDDTTSITVIGMAQPNL
jgi:hypothetical protein